MGARELTVGDEQDWITSEFFAPAATDLVDGLVGRYNQARKRISEVAAFAQGETCAAVIGYFLQGNATEDRGRISMQSSAQQLFQEQGAVAALNAAYWSEALALTDVYDAMPQDRRNQWNEQIRNPQGVKKSHNRIRAEYRNWLDSDALREQFPNKFDAEGGFTNPADEWEFAPLPEFDEETVRATLQGLLASRAKFLAERVDGIFRALSGEHVTNSPAAFGKRMIIARLISGYGYTDHDRVGYINDLRCVIARFMGRDEPPSWNATSSVVDYARKQRRGEWVTLDGGTIRLRAYKCGTAHLEVHPDMAWRLNCVLAHLYPMAIPPEFREKPKKRAKDFVMMGRPLPFAVIGALECLEQAYNLVKTEPHEWRHGEYKRVSIRNALQFSYRVTDNKAMRDEAERVLAYLGGVKIENDRRGHYFAFDYPPREVLDEVVASGCLPDQKTHQFYPTPERLARIAVELAEIGLGDTCLEPSAGIGGIADFLPVDRMRCIEISDLHCKVLQAKGYDATRADFIDWATRTRDRFDRVVMNPPFSEGRAQAHLEAAASLVKSGGRLVAIVPASMRGKDVLPGWNCTWHGPYDNEFAGTGMSVAILVAEAA